MIIGRNNHETIIKNNDHSHHCRGDNKRESMTAASDTRIIFIKCFSHIYMVIIIYPSIRTVPLSYRNISTCARYAARLQFIFSRCCHLLRRFTVGKPVSTGFPPLNENREFLFLLYFPTFNTAASTQNAVPHKPTLSLPEDSQCSGSDRVPSSTSPQREFSLTHLSHLPT